MKRIPFLISLTIIASVLISSCSSNTTYAEELKVEKATIKSYLSRKGINVLTTYPKTFKEWGDNNYYYSKSSGLYFHLVDTGIALTPGDTLETKDKVVARYIEYNLNVSPDTTKNQWSTLLFPYPSTFTYGNSSESCTGFQEAVGYMKRNGAIAKLIVPSKIGFYYLDNDVTPYGYDLKIKIQK